MENNLPTNQTGQGSLSQQSAPTQPVAPMAQQPPSQMPQGELPQKNSHIIRTLFIMIILAIIVILSVLIYVSFVNNQSDNTTPIRIQIPRSTPAPATIEGELNSIDVGNVDEDLKEIDADLQGL